MKNILLMSAAILALSALSIDAKAGETTKKETAMELHKYDETKGFKGPEDYFTGNVKVGEPFKSGEFNDYQGAMVNFEAGARTAWHTHPKGQTIYIVSGEGRAQSEGQPVRVLRPGDVAWFPAGVKHWHGAAPDSAMSHVAIQSPDEKGEVVTWMEHVSDEDYLKDPE